MEIRHVPIVMNKVECEGNEREVYMFKQEVEVLATAPLGRNASLTK
jgi:hypothetical protein